MLPRQSKRASVTRYRAWTVLYAVWSRLAPKSYEAHAAQLVADLESTAGEGTP